MWSIGFMVAIGLLVGLRWAIHRGLAPERVIETVTPADSGLSYQVVRLPTENGKFLFGWFIPANGSGVGVLSPVVVLLHGWGGNAENLLLLARPLHEAGFALLFMDARCHGQSDEDSFASMPRFAEDLDHAIAWLKARHAIGGRANTSVAGMGQTVHFRVAAPEAVGQEVGVLEEIMRFVAEQYLTSCQTLDLFLRQLDGRPQQRHNLLGSSDLLGVLIRIPALLCLS